MRKKFENEATSWKINEMPIVCSPTFIAGTAGVGSYIDLGVLVLFRNFLGTQDPGIRIWVEGKKKKNFSWFFSTSMIFQSYTAMSSTPVCSTSLKKSSSMAKKTRQHFFNLLSTNIHWVPEILVSGIAPLNKARNVFHFIVWKGGDFFFGCCSRYFGGLKRCN